MLGGEIVAVGTPGQIPQPASLTGRYLSGELQVSMRELGQRRQGREHWLSVVGASLHNLKDVTARFPLGVFTCVTG